MGGAGFYDYHVIVFRGVGTLYLNGRTEKHERGWTGNAEEKERKVEFW